MIRAATIHDSRSIAEIHVTSWKHTYVGQMPDEVLDNLSVSQREAGWREMLSEGRSKVLISEDDGLATGFISFGPSRETNSASIKAGEVFTIYLKPEHQGRGVGFALWRSAIDALRQQGYRTVVVWVLQTNTVARRFYERCGCVVDGQPQAITIGENELREVQYRLTLG